MFLPLLSFDDILTRNKHVFFIYTFGFLISQEQQPDHRGSRWARFFT